MPRHHSLVVHNAVAESKPDGFKAKNIFDLLLPWGTAYEPVKVLQLPYTSVSIRFSSNQLPFSALYFQQKAGGTASKRDNICTQKFYMWKWIGFTGEKRQLLQKQSISIWKTNNQEVNINRAPIQMWTSKQNTAQLCAYFLEGI